MLRVRSLALSLPCYRDVLREVAPHGGRMAFLSRGEHHHDLALAEIGAQAGPPAPRSVGQVHMACKVGDSLDL